MRDPNPEVSGKGLRQLRRAGIETLSGVLREEAQEINEAFMKFITRRMPFVVLKIAQSVDGRIATARGESKWITGPEARKRVHGLRNELDAVLVGVDTIIKDNPSLDCRAPKGRDPFRLIVDSRLRIPLQSKVLHCGDNRTILCCTGKAPEPRIRRLAGMGITVLTVKEKQGRVDLKALMRELGRRDIMSIMIEGGSSVSASALASGIVDKVMVFVAPKLIGGADAVPSIGGASPRLLKHARDLRKVRWQRYGRDLLIEGYLPN
jgi:diaminohydroxyphosphoribosylaminopyrimidine deaminase/5-amino-6-(5-phosphoribosylamino)uracil reductase